MLIVFYERIRVHYYDPSHSEKVKRFQGITIINEYLKSLALYNDATYTMVMEGANELCKRLECTLGIHDKSSGIYLLIYTPLLYKITP